MISVKSAKRYCKDDISLIENYDEAIKDKDNVWDLHHRLEISLEGKEVHTHKSLKQLGMYYKRPYFELIFLKHGDHAALHNRVKGSKSLEVRNKISKTLTGNVHHDADMRKKISEGTSKGVANWWANMTPEKKKQIIEKIKATKAKKKLMRSHNA